jgi:hypothetical protein
VESPYQNTSPKISAHSTPKKEKTRKNTHEMGKKNIQPHTNTPKKHHLFQKIKKPQKSTKKVKSKRKRKKRKETKQNKPTTNKRTTQKICFPRINKNIINQKKTNIVTLINTKHEYTYKSKKTTIINT